MSVFFSPEKKKTVLGCFELRIHQELRNASHPNFAMINEMNVISIIITGMLLLVDDIQQLQFSCTETYIL